MTEAFPFTIKGGISERPFGWFAEALPELGKSTDRLLSSSIERHFQIIQPCIASLFDVESHFLK